MAWGAAAACVLACACHNPPSKKFTALGKEKILKSFSPGIDIHAVSAVAVPGGRAFLAWSSDEGVRGMFLSGSGRPMGGEIVISSEPAKFLEAAAAGCGGPKETILLLSIPFTSPLEGNKSGRLQVLGGDGTPTGLESDIGQIGPYSMGGAVSGRCDHAVVAWHTGKIGEFACKVARVGLQDMEPAWQRSLSTPGLNAFLPALASQGGLTAAAWFEKKMRIGKSQEEEGRKGSLKLAIFDAGGRTIRAPSSVALSVLPMAAPDVLFDGGAVLLVYKDHPEGEDRDGIYWLKLDSKGNREAAPRRIARADGPEGPILLKLPGIGFSTVALRRLAGDQLLGVNILDGGGKKLQRELQIYSHGMKYKTVAAVLVEKTILSIYSACDHAGCKLCVTDVAIR